MERHTFANLSLSNEQHNEHHKDHRFVYTETRNQFQRTSSTWATPHQLSLSVSALSRMESSFIFFASQWKIQTEADVCGEGKGVKKSEKKNWWIADGGFRFCWVCPCNDFYEPWKIEMSKGHNKIQWYFFVQAEWLLDWGEGEHGNGVGYFCCFGLLFFSHCFGFAVVLDTYRNSVWELTRSVSKFLFASHMKSGIPY